MNKDGTPENPWGMQPGMLSGQYSERSDYYIKTGSDYGNNLLIELIRDDAEKMGLTVKEYEEGMTGGYCIAIAVKKENDYHFYRENGDGTWSEKRGLREVNTEIINPQIAAYDRGYKIFLGYFYVSEKEDY